VSDRQAEERFFERLGDATDRGRTGPKAPARLKARIYSAMMVRASRDGSLRSIPETKRQGGRLCAFEELVRIAPVSEKMKSLNICRVCHARLLAETLERAPIFWEGCPYVDFTR
jgi:hypothetical protein